MSQMQSTSVCDKLALALLTAHGGSPPSPPLDGVKLMLFSNVIPFRKDLALSDLTECVFSGYAKTAAITWNAAVKEADGSYSASSASKQIQAVSASPFVPDTIAGVAVIDGSTPPNLMYVCQLDTPVVIDSEDKGIDLIATVNQGGLSVNTEITAVS